MTKNKQCSGSVSFAGIPLVTAGPSVRCKREICARIPEAVALSLCARCYFVQTQKRS